MVTDEQARKGSVRRSVSAATPTGPIYFLGGVGAAVYFFQNVATFWGGVLAILKALVWPALLVYRALEALH